ncbi:hypothetical protein ACFVWG_25545 [Kribbella sp. NPDC058245]|uniref:hypothetical protein n=1 Tax=Kribbella sp. NPDC058245 TaxID=3346399 RepID=UPI0036F08EF7
MNEILIEAEITPLYGQVLVQDVATVDVPDWGTGEEAVVASEQAVAVATRSDADGTVMMRVARGSDIGVLGTEVFTGELSLTSATLEIGSPLASDLHTVDVGRAGSLPMRIFVSPEEMPDTVTILLGP